jgi:prevent-host-death family protein
MARVYSTYEAKAKLSEILRKVRGGQRIGISYRGEIVAEVTPVEPPAETAAGRLRRLQDEGTIVPARSQSRAFPRLARKPGAVKRFLDSRE